MKSVLPVSSSGFAMPIVLLIAVLSAFILVKVYLDQKRSQVLLYTENINFNLSEVNSRLSKVFESVELCTCNIRNILLQPTAGGTALETRLDSSTPRRFGFYGLNPCVAPNELDTVVSTDNAVSLSNNRIRATEVRFENFVLQSTVAGENRYRGRLSFVYDPNQNRENTSAIRTVAAKSTTNNPISIDVLVGVAPGGVINRCYASTPAPLPINGQCGAAQNGSFRNPSDIPTASACPPGTLASDPIVSNAKIVWTCNGSNGGANANCIANLIYDGACGPSGGGSYRGANEIIYPCSNGGPSAFSVSGNQWRWDCSGTNGGNPVNCTANLIADGQCGPANGGNYPNVASFAGSLCSTSWGNSAVQGDNPWTWSCNGVNGGFPDSCSSNQTANGTCGIQNNQMYPTTIAANAAGPLCPTGTLTPAGASFTATGALSWSCQGLNGGGSVNCTSTVLPSEGVLICPGHDSGYDVCMQQPADECSGSPVCSGHGSSCSPIGSTQTMPCYNVCRPNSQAQGHCNPASGYEIFLFNRQCVCAEIESGGA